MNKIVGNQRGAFVVIFAIALLVLLGFVALGIEAGRWYLVRAELSKSVDAASLAGAKNISNPFASARQIAEEFGRENFQAGYLGTPGSDTAGTVNFTATMPESDKIHVTGNVNATATLARLFGVDTIPVGAVGMAQRKEVEIMMILDRSGSMAGTKMTDLKTAAKSFLAHFEDTQDKDKVGLINFAATVKYEWDLQTNFYTTANINKINNMSASGGTNMESALYAADGWTDSTTTASGNTFITTNGTSHTGFTDQTGIPGDRRVQQFVVFFSDGMPTCFTGRFRYRGGNFNAVACNLDGCMPGETSAIWRNLNKPNPGCEGQQSCYLYDINARQPTSDPPNTHTLPLPTGDGGTTLSNLRGYFCDIDSSPWQTQSTCNRYTLRWYMFDTRPVSGYSPTYANIPESLFNGRSGYMCSTARDLATARAQELKNRGIKIYVIGLGTSSQIDEAYLRSLSSGTGFAYIAPTSADLLALFNRVAKEIKLRLVY